jgi:hypothetical protein
VQYVTVTSWKVRFANHRAKCWKTIAWPSDVDDPNPLILIEKMLFTKSPWETPHRTRGDPFNRWRLAGLHHAATTFLIRAAEARPDEPDGYSLIVADPSILVTILKDFGAIKPRLLAIDWEMLIPVSSVWSCSGAEDSREFLAYAGLDGRLRSCEPQQPDPRSAYNRVLVWERDGETVPCLDTHTLE